MHLCPEPYIGTHTQACIARAIVCARAYTHTFTHTYRSRCRCRCTRAWVMQVAFFPFGESIIPAARGCLAAWKSRGTPRSWGSLPRDTPRQQCTDPRLMHPRRSWSLKYWKLHREYINPLPTRKTLFLSSATPYRCRAAPFHPLASHFYRRGNNARMARRAFLRDHCCRDHSPTERIGV